MSSARVQQVACVESFGERREDRLRAVAGFVAVLLFQQQSGQAM
jgi:hypothetical protein